MEKITKPLTPKDITILAGILEVDMLEQEMDSFGLKLGGLLRKVEQLSTPFINEDEIFIIQEGYGDLRKLIEDAIETYERIRKFVPNGAE